MPIPTLKLVSSVAESGFDAVIDVLLSSAESDIAEVKALAAIDSGIDGKISVVASASAAGGRVINTPVGSLTGPGDDPTRIHEQVEAAMKIAIKAGAVNPIVRVSGSLAAVDAEYAKSNLVAALGALEGCYRTLQTRTALGEDVVEPVKQIGFLFDGASAAAASSGADSGEEVIRKAAAVEAGRRVARDITSGDPEVMTPLLAAEYVKEAFAGDDAVKITVVKDPATLAKEYPLLNAVNRASVPRHAACIVKLEYTPATVNRCVAIVGKGVTYDTGGADIKAGGVMAGMKRDKGGAAATAGFMKTVAAAKPDGTAYIGYLALVRNSVGSEAYVADEIITSSAGKRVLVVNTDAEGRMAMADPLREARDWVLSMAADSSNGVTHADPSTMQVHTMATLTGHAVIAVGAYPIAVDNYPASTKHGGAGTAGGIVAAAHGIADPFEKSTLRKQDYAMVAPKHSSYDVNQCNNAASSRTPRGHQFPAAFLIQASGLGDHGRASAAPIPYTHLDIAAAASVGDCISGYETGRPVAGLSAYYLGF